jgi:hypothetical protein
VHVGLDRQPSRRRLGAAEHRKELGKEKLIVAFRSNATISYQRGGCEYLLGLASPQGSQQIVERKAISSDQTFPLGYAAYLGET